MVIAKQLITIQESLSINIIKRCGMSKNWKMMILIIASLMSFNVWAKLPYYPIEFPRDEAAHFENVPYQGQFKKMMEWWYFNGTLVSKTGKKLGYYISFNYMYEPTRNIMVPFIQFQVTDIDYQKVYAKQLFLLDPKTYSFSSTALDIHYGDKYSLQKINGTYLLQGNIPSNQGVNLEFALRLTQKPVSDVLLVNEKGLVDMWNDTNSYYYSFTKLMTSGYFKVGNEFYELDPKNSLSWFDHQWGDFIIVPGQNQWMWTSIQLENGLDINLGVILDKVTKQPASATVNIVMPDNSRVFITDISKFKYIPQEVKPGEKHPLSYELDIPQIKLHLNLTALAAGQDLNGIWEGVSKVEGVYQGQPIKGQAYTENTVHYNK